MDILLICYNRPEYVKKVLDSLKFIKDIDNLFISVDAPKNDDFNDKILVERTIQIINEYKFANKYVSYNQVKLGCKKHVHFALKWVNDNVDNENNNEKYLEMKSKVKPITSIEVKESDMIIEECAGGQCPIK